MAGTRKTSKMVADGKKVEFAKNAMRDALVVAHNTGNKKAITEETAVACGVATADFKTWKEDVNALRTVVWDYVLKKNEARRDEKITATQLKASRDLIFPKWKTVLSGGEKRCLEKTMHVDVNDVEDLIAFCWDFLGTENGTILTKTGEGVFRRKVESLIGVIMAKNEILNDEDRDKLTEYYGYQRTITKCLNKISEQQELIKTYKLTKSTVKGEKEFVKYLDKLIKMAEDEVKSAENDKKKAEEKRDEVSAEAQAIEARIKAIS